jgi:FAD synthetase
MSNRVLCCGTFDHLHPGHESFLRQAADLGDELFVVVARDENVCRIKGRFPDENEEVRLAAVAALEFVDDSRLGYPGQNFLRVVEDIGPTIIALGYDQHAPPKLADAFPDCEITVLTPYHPEKYKSSLFRSAGPSQTTG